MIVWLTRTRNVSAQGKNDHTQLLPASQLGEPHIDVVLRPGDALYIPRGTIVATSTLGTQPQSILGAASLLSMAHNCVLSPDVLRQA